MMVRDESGMAAVTTIVLLPLLIVAVAGVLQLGALRVSAARVRAGADLATLVAVNDQDDAELARTGTLRLAADATADARDYFARELELSASLLAAAPDAIAAAADVAAYPTAPAVDTLTGRRYEAPAVRISADVPIRTPVFGALVLQPVTKIHVVAASSPR